MKCLRFRKEHNVVHAAPVREIYSYLCLHGKRLAGSKGGLLRSPRLSDIESIMFLLER